MAEPFGQRLKHAWNAFLNPDNKLDSRSGYGYGSGGYMDVGMTYSTKPDRVRLAYGNERSIISSIYNRIAMDVASVSVQHVRLDKNKRYVEEMKSDLNSCLTLEANLDQSGKNLIQDAVTSMFDEGCVAIVPVDTTINPTLSGGYEIQSLRTAKVIEWSPQHVRLEIYNDRIGRKEEITLPKKMVALVENPLYLVMNEPNSTLKRLVHKLNLLDAIDEQSSSGKLDLIIQLPYIVKSPARKEQAEQRRKDIEMQLTGSKYGIAYTDGTERITQLNRPVENNLMAQIEYLTSMLYSQLGMTEAIFNGTASEQEILNYYNRTIEPILSAITDGMNRTFLTKTARTQGQSIILLQRSFQACTFKQPC